MAIQLILESDTPNEGRVKINSNFNELESDSTGYLMADGSIKWTGSQDADGQRLINLATDPNNLLDAVNVQTLRTWTDKNIKKNHIYVSTNYTTKVTYYGQDGTTEIAYGVSNMDDAFNLIPADTTTDNWWTIEVAENSNYYPVADMTLLPDYVNVVGIGKPVIPFTGNITGLSKWKDIVLAVTTGGGITIKNLFLENFAIKFTGNDLLVEEKVFAKSSYFVCEASDRIILASDSSAGVLRYFYFSNCDLSVDFEGIGLLDGGVSNTISSDLKSYLENSLFFKGL